MGYNGKLLGRAREAQEQLRRKNSEEQRRRTEDTYSRIPRVRTIDSILRQQMVELMRLTISHERDISERLTLMEEDNLRLQSERADLLVAAGLPETYTDDIYSCKKCHDSGMDGVSICSCLKRLYNKELTKELAPLLRAGDESFATFDLNYYDSTRDTETGISPRACMELVYNTCREYATSFGPKSPNLLFQGGTGLGKTFLSACIARVVAEGGHSVAYDSMPSALTFFETQKFSRDSSEVDDAGATVRHYLNCDLMILDDLGTEMVTTFSVSALYQLINTRLINGKQTIISTNLSNSEIARKYGQPISSRLTGEYAAMPFVGRDIRLIRRERS